MFRSALVLLTAIAVLWHALAGCCAHHGHDVATAETSACSCHSHACEAEGTEHSRASEAATHDEDADPLAHLASPHDSSCHGCGGRCSFPQPEGSGISLLKHSLAACDPALPVLMQIAFSKIPATEPKNGFDAPPPGSVGLALRRHLAFGVLLI